MKLLRLRMLSCLMAASALTLHAQSPNPVPGTFEANHVRAVTMSDGALFTDGQTGQFIPVEPGLAEKTLLNRSGLWVVGKFAFGDYVGAVQTNAQTDFIPGVISLSDPYQLNGFWNVSCNDVRQHVEDFQDNGVIDNPNPVIFGWPSHGNSSFSAYNQGETLPYSPYALCGYMDNGPTFGTYEPDEGDLPSVEIRGCYLGSNAPDQMSWFAFNDLKDIHPSSMLPIGLEMQTQMFAYASPQSQADKTIFVRYKMINTQNSDIEDCYMGIYTDFSVGNPGDDFAGCDPEKQMMFAYNGDAVDEAGFGTEIPAVGVELLRGPWQVVGAQIVDQPVAKYMILNNVGNLQAVAYHRILSGKFADGTPAPNDGVMFAGNPNDPNSNSEIAAGSTPGKRLGVASYGPFTLQPGAVHEIIVAYSYAYAAGNTPAQNVQLLLENAVGPKAIFDNCFASSFNECSLSSPTLEPVKDSALRIFPNPANATLMVENDSEPFNRIEVFNALGQSVRREYLDAAVNSISLTTENLPAGAYWLRVGTQTSSFVVEH